MRIKSIHIWGIILATSFLMACQPSGPKLEVGTWRAELNLGNGRVLPFFFDIEANAEGYIGSIRNGEEKLALESVALRGDSVFLQLAIFDSEVEAKLLADGSLLGTWNNYARGKDYRIPFVADRQTESLFRLSTDQSSQIAPTWEVTFIPNDDDDPYPAIGKFTQNGQELYGTFLTETGDYRYLAGNVDGSEMKLSTFDGSHAFLFEAELNEGQMKGTFYSGIHYTAAFEGSVNPAAKLRDADSLTYLKEGYDKLEFSFPNLDGKMVSLADKAYQGKPVVVQLMGSWCPNCMDESKLFSKWYEKYKDQGVEFIALAFEYNVDEETAIRNLKRLKDHFNIEYELLLASTEYDKEKAAEKLPMLNHIMSYPTSIWMDRDGDIRKIHTGFSGPGTGAPYTEFVEEYSSLIEEMIAE